MRFICCILDQFEQPCAGCYSLISVVAALILPLEAVVGRLLFMLEEAVRVKPYSGEIKKYCVMRTKVVLWLKSLLSE